MPFISYQECLNRLRAQTAQGQPIIGTGAGTGISAKFAERGGVDLIIIYNSGRYRMAGRGSAAGILAYGDANAIVVDMAREVLPVVRDTPVLAGVCGTDPFRLMPVFLRQLKEMGFDGVQNFPTVGVIDGNFRQTLEETGMSYDLEVEMIRTAHEMEMLTCPYVFDEEQAARMAEVGADVIVAHMSTTVAGVGGDSEVPQDPLDVISQPLPVPPHREVVGQHPERRLALPPDPFQLLLGYATGCAHLHRNLGGRPYPGNGCTA
jgi:predicted TIM-barrel enzyme